MHHCIAYLINLVHITTAIFILPVDEGILFCTVRFSCFFFFILSLEFEED